MKSMGDAKLDIKLNIVGKTYSMRIDPAKEEVYRLAEREVNRYVTKFQQKRIDGYGVQDYLAVVALQLAMSNIRLAQDREVGDEDLKRIAQLSEQLEEYLSK